MLTYTDYDADLDYDAILDYDGAADIVAGGSADGGAGKKNKKRKNKIFYAPSHIAKIVERYNAGLEPNKQDLSEKDILAFDSYIEEQVQIFGHQENANLLQHSIANELYNFLPENNKNVNKIDFADFFGNYLVIEKLNAARIRKYQESVEVKNRQIIQERLNAQYEEDSEMMIMILASL